MAKLRGRAKAEFLARMARGRRAARNPRARRARPGAGGGGRARVASPTQRHIARPTQTPTRRSGGKRKLQRTPAQKAATAKLIRLNRQRAAYEGRSRAVRKRELGLADRRGRPVRGRLWPASPAQTTKAGPRNPHSKFKLQSRTNKRTGKFRPNYYSIPYYRRSVKKSARRHGRNKARGVARGQLRAITTIPAGAKVAGLVRMNPRTGELEMARGRRVIVANPRRRKRRRATNPRKRRRARNPRRYTSVRNPSIGGLISAAKSIIPGQIAGAAGGLASSFLDAKWFARKPMMGVLSKVLVGAIGAMMLRGKREAAVGFAGGMMGSIGYSYGTKMFGGGFVAPTRGTALQEMGELAAGDSEIAAYLADADDISDLVIAGGLADGELDESQLADLVED